MNGSTLVGIDALNHLSFILLFAANSAGTRTRLHALAALSLAMGIAFMHLKGIESSVWWLSVLLLQNLWQILRHLRAARSHEDMRQRH